MGAEGLAATVPECSSRNLFDMAHDVFISYSSKDKSVADAACAILEARGVRCWLAPRDILPGSEWGAAIIEAISKSRVMVLIYTASSNASPQVRREVERAVSRGLHVIPFRVEDVPMSPALEYFISTPHWLDAISPPMERHLDQLAKIIKAVLDAQKGAEGPAVAEAAAAVQSPKTAAVGDEGWTHGPPPSAFASNRPTPVILSTAKKKVTIGAVAAVLVVVTAIVIYVATRPPRNDQAAAKAPPPISPPANVAQEPAVKPAPTPAVVETAPKPAPVPAPAPPPSPKRVEPNDDEVKRFWGLLAEGSPRLPRLQEMLDDFPKLADRKNATGNTPLYEAAKAGQTRVVTMLLNSGADRKGLSAGRNTPLHGLAAAEGTIDSALVEPLAPGNLDVRNDDGRTALDVAVSLGHAETVKLLAGAGSDVNPPDKSGRTPLQVAMSLDNAQQASAVAPALINAGAKVDAADRRGNTPLHLAAQSGDATLAKLILDKGAKVDATGAGGQTALHVAVAGGKSDVVKLLLAAKGSPEVSDDGGNTPLHLAASQSDTTIAEMLLAAGAKVTTSTKEKQTPLHAAAAAGNSAMVQLFMRNGGSDVLTKAQSPTPVEVAEKAGKKDVAQLLRQLEFPAMLDGAIRASNQPPPARLLEMIRKNPALADAGGADRRNALHKCAVYGNTAFAAELIKINPQLVRGFSASDETPLHLAVVNKKPEVAKLLLANAASVRATTTNGDTPLHLAARTNAGANIIKLLLDAGADPGTSNKAGDQPADLTKDPRTRTLLADASKEADALRAAWSAIDLSGRGFDVTGPGITKSIRVRFAGGGTFNAEGEVNGTFRTVTGSYSKGSLTLTMEPVDGPLFTGTGAILSGKVNVPAEDGKFTWKVAGEKEFQFQRR
jgi:ankyrin repeat protein